MASKLCCTAEQNSRPSSPALPNARLSHAAPQGRPLLPPLSHAGSWRLTSTPSEDLHELRDMFENAQDCSHSQASPIPAPRMPFGRPSMQSLRSLHKMTSMRSIIKRRFSKDLPKQSLAMDRVHSDTKTSSVAKEPDSIVRQPKIIQSQPPNIPRANLKTVLRSERNIHGSEYDADAVIIDDIGKRLEKKPLVSRPSIHSIDWTPSTNR